MNKEMNSIYTFWKLISEKKIEIPIIQRDYAQGREDKKELRYTFLNSLYNALDNKSNINLDFIYGNSKNNVFQPLDGQQRLTTLFLLHWYLACKENKLDNSTKKILSKFTYETRSSSREFCYALINKKIDFIITDTQISCIIKNSSWYYLSWSDDPTIDAMLRTLDDIHHLFKDCNEFYTLLVDTGIISFYYIELEDFGLTDDLYIKMNARGKLLTTFETFKASFQKYIDDKSWESEMHITDSFAFKADTTWADLFWKYNLNYSIDSMFIRFIATVGMIMIPFEKNDDRMSEISKLQMSANSISKENFTINGYSYLRNCLDKYASFDEAKLNFDFPLWQHKPDNTMFTAIIKEGPNASYTQKVLFYAQTEYLLKCTNFNKNKFLDWMRVIRNIVSRGDATKTGSRPTIIRSPETFVGIILLIKELSNGCNDIYNFLSSHSFKSTFAREQIREEILKSKLILESDDYKKAIFKAEDSEFCLGRIEFLLYCIDYKNDSDYFDLAKFNQLIDVVNKYLKNKISNKFRRGLLTIPDITGKHNYYDYWLSYSYAVDAEKRCLIESYREIEYYLFGNYKDNALFRNYFKKLLIILTEKDLDQIIKEFDPPAGMKNWKVRLIKEPNLLDEFCNSKYIAISSDEKYCYLLKSQRPRSMDACERIE